MKEFLRATVKNNCLHIRLNADMKAVQSSVGSGAMLFKRTDQVVSDHLC